MQSYRYFYLQKRKTNNTKILLFFIFLEMYLERFLEFHHAKHNSCILKYRQLFAGKSNEQKHCFSRKYPAKIHKVSEVTPH